jgi:hypothetical protein
MGPRTMQSFRSPIHSSPCRTSSSLARSGYGKAVVVSLVALAGPINAQDRNANWALGLATDRPDLAWQLFQDVTMQDAPGGPMAWEGWKATPQVYLPNGASPAPWGDPPLRLIGDGVANEDKGPVVVLRDGVHLESTFLDNPVDGGLRDLKGRPIFSEIRMNEVIFNEVVALQLYNVEGQLAFNAKGQNLNLPEGAIEVKVTWRILDADEGPLADTYLRTTATDTTNGTESTVTLGMTGMNIIAKVDGQWFATAFEHEANGDTTLDENYPHIRLSLRPPDDYVAANTEAASQFAGTPLAHYRAVGGQQSFVASDGLPIFLTNTQQETQIVNTSSCLSCHAYSGIGMIDGKPTRLLPLLTHNADGTATGYLGIPDANVLKRFTTFDMMWSMIEASPIDPPIDPAHPTPEVQMMKVSELPPIAE